MAWLLKARYGQPVLFFSETIAGGDGTGDHKVFQKPLAGLPDAVFADFILRKQVVGDQAVDTQLQVNLLYFWPVPDTATVDGCCSSEPAPATIGFDRAAPDNKGLSCLLQDTG